MRSRFDISDVFDEMDILSREDSIEVASTDTTRVMGMGALKITCNYSFRGWEGRSVPRRLRMMSEDREWILRTGSVSSIGGTCTGGC